MTAVLFIVLLSIIVTIHEFGHFLVAKAFGVYCFEFSIGMGPALFTRKGKETKFSIRALPIGGYVAMAGETEGDEAYPDVKVLREEELQTKNHGRRFVSCLQVSQ